MYPDTFEEQIHRPLGVGGGVGAYMAGMRCPTAERLTKLVHDISDIEDWEKHAVRELFGQLSPEECFEFVVTTNGASRGCPADARIPRPARRRGQLDQPVLLGPQLA